MSAWTYEHDILGNRTRRNASTASHAHPMRYDWDVLNRATLIAQPSGGAGYAYRADGQRIEKVEGITFSWSGSRESGQYDTNYAQNRPTSRYYYDGQMGFEDDYNPSGTVTQVNRYALGARGIDRVARTESGNTTLAYPLYDGHGNMSALLTRDGTGYDTGNWKTYDVWGSVRSGGSSADPKQGYVASIGHVSDDESSLIYMRARYYEAATGRFISEDPAGDGINWYIYCKNNPINRSDISGCNSQLVATALLIAGVLSAMIGGLLLGLGVMFDARARSLMKLAESLSSQADWARDSSGLLRYDMRELAGDLEMKALLKSGEAQSLTERAGRMKRIGGRLGGAGVLAIVGYLLLVQAFLFDTELAMMGSEWSVFDFVGF